MNVKIYKLKNNHFQNNLENKQQMNSLNHKFKLKTYSVN